MSNSWTFGQEPNGNLTWIERLFSEYEFKILNCWCQVQGSGLCWWSPEGFIHDERVQTFKMRSNNWVETATFQYLSTFSQAKREQTNTEAHPHQWRMWGLKSAHLCSSFCFKVSGAKLQWIACWERAHTASRLRLNVDAAKWYSLESSVQNTPLSSVWVEKEENEDDVNFFINLSAWITIK